MMIAKLTGLAQPEYYRQAYALQGCVLGELASSAYRCGPSGKFYICRPRNAATKSQLADMQRAIDAFLLRLPLFRATEIPLPENPIGASRSGYDGNIGPVTSGIGETALIGAAEVVKAAGEGDAPPTISLVMRDFTNEARRTENFTKFAPEITAYLNDVTSRFDQLLEQIKKRRAEGERPVVVEPPPLPVPADVQPLVRKKRFPTALVVAMGVGAAAAIGGAVYLGRRSAREEEAVAGLGRHRRRHRR